MTTIRLLSDGFEVSGHAGYAEAGEDIVCAAITSAVRLTDCLLSDELGLNTHPDIREEEGFLALRLTSQDACRPEAAHALSAFGRYARQLEQEYSHYVRVSG